MIEIEADFSTTVRGGMIRAYRSDAPGVEVGDFVRAVDYDEELSYLGTVYEIDEQFVYLVMHWRNTREAISLPGGVWYSVGNEENVTGGIGRSHDEQTVQYAVAV